MQIVIIGLLLGMLIAASANVCLIWKIQRVYSKVWGSDVSTVAWRRKQWAFVFILAAQALGVAAVLFKTEHWSITLAYFGLMILSLLGFFDSYRILLADLKKLPRKTQSGG